MRVHMSPMGVRSAHSSDAGSETHDLTHLFHSGLQKTGTICPLCLSNLSSWRPDCIGDRRREVRYGSSCVGRSITSSLRRQSSSSKRSRGSRAAVLPRPSGHARGTWRSFRSRPKGPTASWRATRAARSFVWATRPSSTRKKTTNRLTPGSRPRRFLCRPSSILAKTCATCERSSLRRGNGYSYNSKV